MPYHTTVTAANLMLVILLSQPPYIYIISTHWHGICYLLAWLGLGRLRLLFVQSVPLPGLPELPIHLLILKELLHGCTFLAGCTVD